MEAFTISHPIPKAVRSGGVGGEGVGGEHAFLIVFSFV